jgi:hypothetical protein
MQVFLPFFLTSAWFCLQVNNFMTSFTHGKFYFNSIIFKFAWKRKVLATLKTIVKVKLPADST